MTECVVVDEDKQRRDEVVVSDKGFGVGEREMLGKRKIEKERKKMVIDNQQSMTVWWLTEISNREVEWWPTTDSMEQCWLFE